MIRHTLLTCLLFITLITPAYSRQVRPSPSATKQKPALPYVTRAGNTSLRLAIGADSAIVDLKNDIQGCVGKLYDSFSTMKVVGKAIPKIKVLDRVAKDNNYYVVVLTTATSNCNIQGQCGAADDLTLIWLKLDSHLKLEGKKAIAIEQCRAFLHLVEPKLDYDGYGNNSIKLSQGKLKMKFADEMDFDGSKHTLSELIYDRSIPENGFIVTTQKMNK
ncbi:MAG: hypothetical protein IPL01_24210 [Acidobacteria bacterium]|nr:hypothetical protein [Acidobacteriota bacterium]